MLNEKKVIVNETTLTGKPCTITYRQDRDDKDSILMTKSYDKYGKYWMTLNDLPEEVAKQFIA